MNWLEHKPDNFEYRGRWIDNWFSNMAPSSVEIDGETWPSVENYYQAMKTFDDEMRREIRNASPSNAKRLGRKVNLREDWEKVKISIMTKAVYCKFDQYPDLTERLINSPTPIIEWNNWKDTTWGVTLDGKGLNLLGVILTSVRELLIVKRVFK